jgi:hypothetical protein
MTDNELRDAATIMRQRAQRVGPMHSFWDAILDIEMLLAGLPISRSRAAVVAEVEEILKSPKGA